MRFVQQPARLALVLICAAASTHAASPPVLSPLVVRPIAPAEPVSGADGRVHLAYELLILNLASAPVTVDGVEVLNAADQAVVERMQGSDLAAALRLTAGGTGTTIGGASTAALFMDVSLPSSARPPHALTHRFSISVAAPPTTSGHDLDPPPAPPKTIAFTGALVDVAQRRAVVLAPPLRGPRWLIGNGCCAAITAHRGATLPIDGTIHVAERFAIDFVQLEADGRLFNGDKAALSSYAFFGVEVLSAAAGVVVATEDGLPEQVPGRLPADATILNAPGNHVVVDIGGGRFAFYAHLQPGSLRVHTGERVRRGQPLGLLGNSGNTDAPHLHFQVMDGPSPLVSNGLPYVFTSFVGEGRVTNEEAVENGEPASVDRGALAGPHVDQLPLNDQIVAFP